MIHSRGTVTLVPYGTSNPLVTFSAPALQPHTISFQLAASDASLQASIKDVSGVLTGTMAFVSDGLDINVQSLGYGVPLQSSYSHEHEIDFLVRAHAAGCNP